MRLKPVPAENLPSLRYVVSKFRMVTRQLEALEHDIRASDFWLVYQLTSLLDSSTRRSWELGRHKRDGSTLDDLFDFLDERIYSLSVAMRATTSRSTTSSVAQPPKPAVKRVNQISNQGESCRFCKQGVHILELCEKFLGLNPYPRSQKVKSLRACFNCLSYQHTLDSCPLPPCSHCATGKKHHKLLCFAYCDELKKKESTDATVATLMLQPGQCDLEIDDSEGVLLGTAMVLVRASSGEFLPARVLMDTGSQANLISENCVQQLRLPRSYRNASVSPVGESNRLEARGIVRLVMIPHNGDARFQLTVNTLIMNRIASVLPGDNIDISDLPPHVSQQLADPAFREAGRIDILLGANVWSRILMASLHSSETSNLVAQLTRFGWVVFGGLQTPNNNLVGLAEVHPPENGELNQLLQRFWQMDELPKMHHRSTEEEMCEEIFARGFERTSGGRFSVPIPLKSNAGPLGESKKRALQTLRAMENKFARKPSFHRNYVEFMRNLIAKGIMTRFANIDESKPYFYLPHHGIEGKKKKHRTVFNGSALTTSGESFNDIQMKGEKLQDNLFDILLRFRSRRIALVGDIEQMYPQVLIKPEYHQMQLVLWRETKNEPIITYCLNTVMFGMRYALHSAVRSLQQCAIEAEKEYPLASAVARRDFYVDDLITGGDTIEEVIELRHQMQSMLAGGGFPIKKWCSSSWSVQSSIGDDMSSAKHYFENAEDTNQWVLGVSWNPSLDQLRFEVDENSWADVTTKRTVTSDVAKLFDPLGLLTPVVTRGKMMIREMWIANFDWDAKLPVEIQNRWLGFRATLKQAERVGVPRWMGMLSTTPFELHGFCDASASAYAAAIYYKVTDPNGLVQCGLLTSKSRVAPTQTISIPRLELSGALLLAQLMKATHEALGDRHITTHYWCDSQIVLHWLAKPPCVFKEFVSNRVTKIQKLTTATNATWHHVPGTSNPADIASRGCDATQIIGYDLWWYGPKWLLSNTSEWPQQPLALSAPIREAAQHELKPSIVAATTVDDLWILNRYHNVSKLFLVTAFIKRFVDNCRALVLRRKGDGAAKTKTTIPLLEMLASLQPISRKEILRSETFWICQVQASAYAEEIQSLANSLKVKGSSKLAKLSPFLDDHNLIRVGGRLQNASMSFDEKHPVILPGKSSFAKMLINKHHITMMHGGTQLVTRSLRQKYWFIGGRNAIRSGIFDCIVCKRHRKGSENQQMAPLVSARVNPVERPFMDISIDYAGPFEVKRWTGRCNTIVKAYVSVFICMATRGIHLEVVTDLTTDAFIDAYERFAARRGHCRSIRSDNAKNYVGAKNKLDRVLEVWQKSAHSSVMASRGIDWIFIMPRSPSQGGSHEAAVKLFKHHLKRVVGTQKPSVLEFQSVITKIEGCLNSRPLGALSEDGSDELALTPAHFLTGGAFEPVPTEVLVAEISSLTSKWRHVQQILHSFWKRWQSDYINHLQVRNKWLYPEENIKVNDVVAICDDNLPPTQWKLGRIIATHPGIDGLVRNLTIRTSTDTIQRATQRVCKLLSAEQLDGNQEEGSVPPQDVAASDK